MLVIGLTGSIATGKSTVSSILAGPPHNLPIIDADLIARKVVEPGQSSYGRIVKHFGPSTPDLLVAASDSMPEDGPDGKGRPLNRRALGQRVFGDSADRRRDRGALNLIVHPAVRWEIFKSVCRCYLSGHWAVVLDVPLLFEARLDALCGTVVVVAVADPEIQMRRLLDRDENLSREEAEDRVRSQADVRTKARRCLARGDGGTKGVVLSNDGTREELRAETDQALHDLRRASPQWWTWLLLAVPPLGISVGLLRLWQNIRINRRWKAQVEEEGEGDGPGHDGGKEEE